MKHAIVPLAALLLYGLAPAAAQPAASGPACLTLRDVYSWEPHGDHAVIASDRAHRRYKVTFRNICSDLQYNLGVAFRSRGSSLSCLSTGDEVTAHATGPFPPPHCIVEKVENYTRAMARADSAAPMAH